MKQIKSVKELQDVIKKMRISSEYKDIQCRINCLELGSVRKAEDLLGYVFLRKLQSANEIIVEFYDKQIEYKTHMCKVNTENSTPIVQSLINMLEQYDVYVDEDELSSEMINSYVDFVKKMFTEHLLPQEMVVRKEIPIETFDISDIVNISL